MKKSDLFIQRYEALHGDIGSACKEVGISRMDVKKLMDRDSEFALKFWEAKEGLIDLMEASLFKMGTFGGDSSAAKAFLKAKAKNRGYDDVPEKKFVKEPEEKNPELDFKDEIKTKRTEDIKKELKNLKKITLNAK